jgi:hypothetical protein
MWGWTGRSPRKWGGLEGAAPAPSNLRGGLEGAAPAPSNLKKPDGVVEEDLGLNSGGEPPRGGPPALLVVVVGDEREVRAEQDAVLVPLDGRGGDGLGVDPHVGGGPGRHGHGGVEVEMRVALGEGQEAAALKGPHVGHAHAQPGKALHDAGEALDPGEGVAIGHGAHVQGEAEAFGLGALVHRNEAGVIDVEPLHGQVELEPPQPESVHSVRRDGDQVGVIGVQGAEGHGLRVARSRPRHPLVEGTGHAGPMRIGEEAEALHAPASERVHHRPRLEGVGAHPVLPREPLLDGRGQARGMQVHVGVEVAHRGPARARLPRPLSAATG